VDDVTQRKIDRRTLLKGAAAAADSVAVRLRHGGDAGTMGLVEFIGAARQAVAQKRKEMISEVKDR